MIKKKENGIENKCGICISLEYNDESSLLFYKDEIREKIINLIGSDNKLENSLELSLPLNINIKVDYFCLNEEAKKLLISLYIPEAYNDMILDLKIKYIMECDKYLSQDDKVFLIKDMCIAHYKTINAIKELNDIE